MAPSYLDQTNTILVLILDPTVHNLVEQKGHRSRLTKSNLILTRFMTADLELKHKNVTKARSIIEKARLRNPQNPDLWRKAILIEWEYGSKDQVTNKILSFLLIFSFFLTVLSYFLLFLFSYGNPVTFLDGSRGVDGKGG